MFAYYGSLVGRWRGSFELRITDRDGLRRLVALDGERVRHTTRVRLVTITQETPFSFGTQILRRVPAMQKVARR